MDRLSERIIRILEKSPADQFSIYKQLKTTTMADLSRAIGQLYQQKAIHVIRYRKSSRIGVNVPLYSITAPKRSRRPDLLRLLSGVTSERVVEYEFLARNLLFPKQKAIILDFGSYWSDLDLALNDFGRGNWRVIGVDLKHEGCDAIMDLRFCGFQSEIIDQVICISTLEHIGLSAGISDHLGDTKAIGEIHRVLKRGGTVVLTVPYGVQTNGINTRVYDRHSLSILVNNFVIIEKEFHAYKRGRWYKCSQRSADVHRSFIPPHFHSSVCACLLLTKR